MNDSSSRPEIKNKDSNLSDYDTVLIGFPVWWDLAPRIINTFIEENNLENKKIYVFATSGGSSVNNSFNTLKNTYSNLNFISAKRLSNNVSDSDITNWIEMQVASGENGNARKFAREMVSSGIVDRVRAEEGNERYEYFFPMDDDETVLLIDRWKNEEALDIHHKSEMM